MSELLEKSISEAQSELKTIRDILRFGLSLFNKYNLFYGHGTTNSYDEVIYLILHNLALPVDFDLNIFMDTVLLKTELNSILNNFVTRIKSHKPAPYITNQAFLQGYRFYIDERSIIPRSFIPEILLNDIINPWLEKIYVSNILDLCTGNGSIAIIASDYFPEAKVFATDIDSSALEIAQINVRDYSLDNRITIVQSDLFKNIPMHKFNIIFSNPPYVDKRRMELLTEEYKYEPQIALYGGENGLQFVKDIINNALNFLSQDGILIVEIGDNKEELEACYEHLGFTWLETQNNQGFVFLLTYEQIDNYFKIN